MNSDVRSNRLTLRVLAVFYAVLAAVTVAVRELEVQALALYKTLGTPLHTNIWLHILSYAITMAAIVCAILLFRLSRYAVWAVLVCLAVSVSYRLVQFLVTDPAILRGSLPSIFFELSLQLFVVFYAISRVERGVLR